MWTGDEIVCAREREWRQATSISAPTTAQGQYEPFIAHRNRWHQVQTFQCSWCRPVNWSSFCWHVV